MPALYSTAQSNNQKHTANCIYIGQNYKSHCISEFYNPSCIQNPPFLDLSGSRRGFLTIREGMCQPNLSLTNTNCKIGGKYFSQRENDIVWGFVQE